MFHIVIQYIYTVFMLMYDMLTQSEQQYYDFVALNGVVFTGENTLDQISVDTRAYKASVANQHMRYCVFYEVIILSIWSN